jgi:hypothetical protein
MEKFGSINTKTLRFSSPNTGYLSLLPILVLVVWAWIHYFGLDASDSTSYLLPDSSSYLSYFNLREDYNSFERTIGYPQFLALFKKLASLVGVNFLYLVGIVQVLLLAISAVLWAMMLSSFASRWITFLLTLLVFGNPSLAVYTHLICTEIFFLFVVTWAFWFGLHFFGSKKLFYLLAALTCCYMATLIRPGLYYFAVLVSILALYYTLRYRKFQTTVLILLLYSLTIVNQQYQFKKQYGVFALSIIDKITMHRYFGNAIQSELEPSDRLERLTRQDHQDAARLAPYSNPERTQVAASYYDSSSKKIICSHPIRATSVFLQNILSNVHTGNGYLDGKTTTTKAKHLYNTSRWYNVAGGVLLLFLTLGIFGKRKDTSLPIAWLFCVIGYCWYCLITSGISYWQGDRFGIVFTPLATLLCLAMATIYFHHKPKQHNESR